MRDPLEHIASGDTVIVAVSGGADSVFLLLRLSEKLGSRGVQIIVVHVNHGLRGDDSEGDQQFVCALSERLGLQCFVQRIDTSVVHAEGSATNEANLRALRLGALKAMARAVGARWIALGHHADDLAETFLINALRGSGVAGLSGMQAITGQAPEPRLIRPLLSFTRVQIEEELRRRGEQWRTDASNDDPRHKRNRIRHEVMPLLRAIDPAAGESLARAAAFSADAARVYTRVAAIHAHRAELGRSDNTILFAARPLRRAKTTELVGEILRVYTRRLLGEQGEVPLLPARAMLAEASHRLMQTEGDAATFELRPGLHLFVENQFALLTRSPDFLSAAFEVADRWPFLFSVAKEQATPATQSSRLAIENRAAASKQPLPSWQAEFESASIVGELKVESTALEAAISLPGGGRKTVARCLQEAGVPVPLRPHVLALRDDAGLLWIPGVRRAPRAMPGAGPVVSIQMQVPARWRAISRR